MRTSEKTSSYIEDTLTCQLREGRWRTGEQLPTEAELSQQYGVCRSTLKKALSALLRKGLLKSHQGKGHFAIQPPERRRTWTIGLTLVASSNFEHPVATQKMSGLHQVLLDTPYRMKILIAYEEMEKKGTPWSPHFLDHVRPDFIDLDLLDGIIISKAGYGESALRKIADEIPVCCTDWFEDGRRLSRVSHDFSGGLAMAVSHLITLGHRRIATLGRPDFFDAFTAGARRGEQTSAPSKALLHEMEEIGDYTRQEGVEAARRILSRPRAEWPTALIGSDEVIAGCLDVIRTLGVSIPADLSLVAINDLDRDAVHGIPLSGIHVDYRQQGRMQAKELLRLLDDPKARGRDILLPVEWFQRESTGPARR